MNIMMKIEMMMRFELMMLLTCNGKVIQRHLSRVIKAVMKLVTLKHRHEKF